MDYGGGDVSEYDLSSVEHHDWQIAGAPGVARVSNVT